MLHKTPVLRAALFIMLDDCLIRTRSRSKYPLHSEDWMFNLQGIEAIKRAIKKRHKIIIISKQPSISAGIIDEKVFLRKVELIMKTLEKDLILLPNSIINLYSVDQESFMFIPCPGLIYEAAIEYELDLPNSTLIYGGDGGFELSNNVNMTSYNILNLAFPTTY